MSLLTHLRDQPLSKNLRVANIFLFAKETTFRWINIFMKRHMTRSFIVARGSLYSKLTADKSLMCWFFYLLRAANLLPSLFAATQIFALRNDYM